MICPAPVLSPIESIPAPDVVRDRLARLFAEARLLRALLRLAEAKCRHVSPGRHPRGSQGEVAHAG